MTLGPGSWVRALRVSVRYFTHRSSPIPPANDPLHPGAYWVVTCKPNFTRFHPWGYTRSPDLVASGPYWTPDGWRPAPEPVSAETRRDSLLPVVQSVSEPLEREAERLAFGGLIEGRADPGGQLPLLPAPEGPRVPLLELADVRGGPIMARGRGAPLDLRLFVGAVLWTPHHARATRGRLAVTVREIRDFLYPHGWKRRGTGQRFRGRCSRRGTS